MIMLLKRDSGVNSHTYQVDKPNPEGKETWSFDKVKEEAITDGKFIEKVKTNVKEGIEFTFQQAAEHK